MDKMIKNSKKLEEFNKELIRQEHHSYEQALKIYESLYKEAVNLKAIDSENPLAGIETNIKLAKALNSLN